MYEHVYEQPDPLHPSGAAHILSERPSPTSPPSPITRLYPLTQTDTQIIMMARTLMSGDAPVTDATRHAHWATWQHLNQVVGTGHHIHAHGVTFDLRQLKQEELVVVKRAVLHGGIPSEGERTWYIAWLTFTCMLTRS